MALDLKATLLFSQKHHCFCFPKQALEGSEEEGCANSIAVKWMEVCLCYLNHTLADEETCLLPSVNFNLPDFGCHAI